MPHLVIFASEREAMLPEQFLERIAAQKYIDAPGLVRALGQPSPVSVRINPRKWDRPVTGYDKVPWEQNGFYLPVRPQFTPDPLFHAGVYYPQEASSMFTGEAFRQVAGDMDGINVLDLCGAPGGKSTHLSTLISGNGLLVANEVIRTRAAVLAETITKWGIGNTVVTQNDPSDFAALPGFFDVIVVDAPCSGEGMFSNAPAVSEWSEQNARLCSDRQRRIVMDVWPSLKDGGVLIYSTCTFNPAENEENIAWFIDHIESEPVALDIARFEGITPVNYKNVTGYGFHPGRVRGDGFFIAVLRKRGGEERGRQYGRIKSHKPDSKILKRIEPLIDVDAARLAVTGDRVIAFAARPDLYSRLAERLRIVKSGTLVGEFRNDDFIPAHDLAMSVMQRSGAWPVYSTTYEEAVSFLRLESFPLSGMPAGRIMMHYRGVPLGFIKNLGNRFNNGYPQGWRIRMEKQASFTEIF